MIFLIYLRKLINENMISIFSFFVLRIKSWKIGVDVSHFINIERKNNNKYCFLIVSYCSNLLE